MAVGDVVAGKYRVEGFRAEDGVALAVVEHEGLVRNVALELAYEMLLPFVRREIRATTAIPSERVVHVFDCGTLEAGVSFMVVEDLLGNDLADEIKWRGPFHFLDAVDWMIGALEGLAEAHARGIVHRNVMPASLFLAERGGGHRFLKVRHFGCAKFEAKAGAEVDDDPADACMLLGRPLFPPEQIRDATDVDVRIDIWSIGAVLYQCLACEPPFAARSVVEVLSKIVLSEPPSIRDKRQDVPEGLAAVIARCLRRDRDERFRNVAELALALAPFSTPSVDPSIERILALFPSVRAP
ncbi:serine/threonine-protein kinase [Polyangium sp. y55x31]|uniref:serine/threonine-protein kinase n=1 Tax=Polyangium sp. y55x31 TaxID=3042688 RepID=UPI002482B190|nr:serine/threonine-protein kinase [Polyangium sp. y55x31]MDI1483793.1 serine/threonine-protein kinase [Polyangium sp. y55x31]